MLYLHSATQVQAFICLLLSHGFNYFAANMTKMSSRSSVFMLSDCFVFTDHWVWCSVLDYNTFPTMVRLFKVCEQSASCSPLCSHHLYLYDLYLEQIMLQLNFHFGCISLTSCAFSMCLNLCSFPCVLLFNCQLLSSLCGVFPPKSLCGCTNVCTLPSEEK